MKNNLVLIAFTTFLVLGLSTTSCQNLQDEVVKDSIVELKANLVKDADFINYSKISKDFREKTVYDYYNCFNRDKALIEANSDKLNDRIQAKAVYEAAGMVNVDEYIDFMDNSATLMKKLLERYPILKKDDFKVMVDVFRELMEKPKFDLSKMSKE